MAGLMTVVALSLLSVNSHASSPTILAVNPVEAPNNFDVTVVITGSDFQTTPAPVVRLGDNPLDLQGEPTGQLLTATVPWGLEPGVYDLSIENADGGSATLTEAFTVTAALGVWVTGGPYGGAIKRLAVSESDPATVFGNLEMIGLVRSDDAGEQWRNLSGGYVTTFALKPGDPQTVYLSAQWDNSSWLLRSSDGGQTWDPLLEMRPWALGVTPADPEVLYFGVKRWSPGPAITRTLNGGNDWETASGGIPQDAWVQALAVHPVTPNIAYAGLASGHVYKTVNGGADWTATIANFGETWWKELVVDPHNPERVYGTGWHGSEFAARSFDGGASWHMMELGVPFAQDIEIHPTVSGTVYALTINGIVSSTDAGLTWEPFFEDGGFWSLALDPQTGFPLYMGHAGDAFARSDDGGHTWQVHNQGLAGIGTHNVAVSPADPRYVYVSAVEAGGFVSNNGGESWRKADLGQFGSIDVAAHPLTPTVAFMQSGNAIFKTTDGGQTWIAKEIPSLPGGEQPQIDVVTIDPSEPEVLYAGGGYGDGHPPEGLLFRSVDEGESWLTLTVGFPISLVSDIAVDPMDSQTLYVATGHRWEGSWEGLGSGIIKSADRGQTWAFINEGLTATNITRLAIVPDNPQILYAGSNLKGWQQENGVYKTVNGGESWSKSGLDWQHISGLEVDPLMTDTVYAGVFWDGLWRTSDGGETWGRVEGALGQLSIKCLDITEVPSRTVVFAGVAGGVVTSPAIQTQEAEAGGTAQDQVYGSGIYLLTVDHRSQPTYVYLPLVLRGGE